MNAATDIRPDLSADRPVYTGMSWTCSRKRQNHWRASSDITPITYVAEEIDDGIWAALQGFPELPGRPNIEIGRFADRQVAMTACERHDFRFWSTESLRSGLTPVFQGSPDHVSDFVANLSDYDRDDLLDMIAGGYELPDGSNFTHSASFFPARKTGLKQEKNGDFTATLTIHAADLPTWLMQCALGTHLVAGVAHAGQDADADWEKRVEQALKRSFALVQDNIFHAWLSEKYDNWGKISVAMMKNSEEVERAVEDTLRRLIGCPSRRYLATNRDAVHKLEKLDREFHLDMSRGFVGSPQVSSSGGPHS